MASPASSLEVILLRHADKDPQRGDYNLSPAGFVRAMALATLIPACLGRPTGITTYMLDPFSSKNARSYQSAVPLAVATGVRIQIAQESAEHSYAIGRGLRQRAKRPGERLVLFWEHRRMPELARGLGWSGMAPIDDGDFDQLFLIRIASPGAPAQVEVLQQEALARRPCYTQARSPFPPSGTWSMPSLDRIP